MFSKRPVGLLDVDGTLLRMGSSAGRDELNLPLIQSLKKAGIKDLYLFTNMDLSTLQDEYTRGLGVKRHEILSMLQKEGFIVHGVVTPADVAYNKGLGAVYTNYIEKNQKRIENHDIGKTRKGKPDFIGDETFINDMEEVSNLKKETARNYKHPDEQRIGNIKSAMYDYFLQEKPEWVGSIVLVDDEKDCIEAVKSVHDNKKPKDITLATILVQDASNKADPFNKKEECKQRSIDSYNDSLYRFQETLPPIQKNNVALNKLYFKPGEHGLSPADYNYTPSNYHVIRKKRLDDKIRNEPETAHPYYTHKLHLAFDIENHPECFDAMWNFLIEVFKEECVYEVKLIDPAKSKQAQHGKAATLYFVAKEHLSEKLSEQQFLDNHVRVMQKLDRRIAELKLPISIKLPDDDHSTEKLGCHSKAVFITPPDHHEDGGYIRAGNREKVFSDPYNKAVETLIENLEAYRKKRNQETGTGTMASFFRNLARLDGGVKTHAADKLIRYFNGNKTLSFSAIDVDALTEPGSELGKIVSSYKSKLIPLPNEILHAYAIQKYKMRQYRRVIL